MPSPCQTLGKSFDRVRPDLQRPRAAAPRGQRATGPHVPARGAHPSCHIGSLPHLPIAIYTKGVGGKVGCARTVGHSYSFEKSGNAMPLPPFSQMSCAAAPPASRRSIATRMAGCLKEAIWPRTPGDEEQQCRMMWWCALNVAAREDVRFAGPHRASAVTKAKILPLNVFLRLQDRQANQSGSFTLIRSFNKPIGFKPIGAVRGSWDTGMIGI